MKKHHLVAVALGAGLCLTALVAYAAAEVTVIQSGRSFPVGHIEIAKGTLVHFSNQDEFIHQIYVKSPDMNFDSAEQVPGTTIDLVFPTTGTFEVRCHIHPKMRLEVTVK